ncbi:LysE/ArgO family amino acid transporter [Candidatus Sororendozoicomonas aggregata]|uniref:LysE/ArgO family amino acid transporter n=1 Tax=Candidatus Sororendozoicomonas aggregata TaxID=3073239 RepID=UPI002ED28E07
MYLFPFLQGLGIGLGMIVPIGAQNAYLINMGIRRNFHLLAAVICIVCDVLLISLGIFGAGALISQNEQVLFFITLAGVVFLTWYGLLSFKRAVKGSASVLASDKGNALTRGKRGVLLGALAVTLLNPHAYLDAMVILGSIGNQMEAELRIAFALGTFTASAIWFFSLTTAAAKFSPWLSKPNVQRSIDGFVAVLMWSIAFSLAVRLI